MESVSHMQWGRNEDEISKFVFVKNKDDTFVRVCTGQQRNYLCTSEYG